MPVTPQTTKVIPKVFPRNKHNLRNHCVCVREKETERSNDECCRRESGLKWKSHKLVNSSGEENMKDNKRKNKEKESNFVNEREKLGKNLQVGREGQKLAKGEHPRLPGVCIYYICTYVVFMDNGNEMNSHTMSAK